MREKQMPVIFYLQVIPAVRLEKAVRDRSKLTPKVIIDKNGHKKTVYIRLVIEVKKDNKVKGHNPVQHEGEFVLTRNGSKDFGEISPEIAKKIRRQSGKIRLRTGIHEGKRGDFGEKHIERTERLQQLRDNGYGNARDLVQDVATTFNAIFKGDGSRLILAKQGTVTDASIFLELIPVEGEEFYDVKTGLIARKNYFKNKMPLWVKPQNGI